MDNWILITGAVLTFLVLVLGTAAVRMATLLLINRREEREHIERKTALRSTERMDAERAEWFALVKDKDARIAELNAELLRQTTNYNNAKKLMQNVKFKEVETR